MKKRWLLVVLALVLVVALVVVAGCGQEPENNVDGNGEQKTEIKDVVIGWRFMVFTGCSVNGSVKG